MRKDAKGEVKAGAHILGTLSLWEDMRPQHTTALTDSHEHWDSCQRYLTWHVRTLFGVWNTCCPLRFRSQVVRDYVNHALLSIHEVRYKRNLHHAMMIPMVVYVPLVMQKVAKYLTWLFVGTVSSKLKLVSAGEYPKCVRKYRYPMAPMRDATAMNQPLVWRRSDAYEKSVNTTAATA